MNKDKIITLDRKSRSRQPSARFNEGYILQNSMITNLNQFPRKVINIDFARIESYTDKKIKVQERILSRAGKAIGTTPATHRGDSDKNSNIFDQIRMLSPYISKPKASRDRNKGLKVFEDNSIDRSLEFEDNMVKREKLEKIKLRVINLIMIRC
jgi:hypothetical protein